MLDTQQKQYIALESYDLPTKAIEAQQLLSNLLSDHTWLTQAYDSSSVAYVNIHSTLIPSAVYQEKDKAAYFNTNISESDLSIATQTVTNLELNVVYGIPEAQKALIKRYFPSAKEFHHTGSLLNALANENMLTQEASVIVNIHDNLVDIIVSKDKQLQLLNTYTYKTKEDYLYFLLNACEQLKLDLEQTPFTVYGRIEKASQLADIMRNYIHKVQFGKRISKFKYGYQMNELPEHFFLNLFSQYLCV